jgi:hypothetical protein
VCYIKHPWCVKILSWTCVWRSWFTRVSIRLLGHQSEWPHSVVMLCTETSSLACLCCLPGSLWGRSDSPATRLANVCRIHVHKLSVVATVSVVVNLDDYLTRPSDTVKCLKMSVKDLCNRLHFGLYCNTQREECRYIYAMWTSRIYSYTPPQTL